ncbi:MAG: RloB family protein [Candidatus Marithrix sp.]
MRDKQLPLSKKRRQLLENQQNARKQLMVGRVLIVCEGEKTEPSYFRWWQEQLKKIRSIAIKKSDIKSKGDIEVNSFGDEIRVEGEGKNTKSLVEEAINLKNKAKTDAKIEYEQVWCVFDRDSFPPNDYNDAIALAHTNNFKVAYSNEAFELWYLLYFNYVNNGVKRKKYKEMLTKCLDEKYEKNDPKMYEKLNKHPKADQKQAIDNAKKLLKQYNGQENYADHNPSTTIFKLVESLNEHVCKFRCQFAPTHPLPYSCECIEKSM